MVAKGIFSVRLVEAETKKAFKEHVKDGKVFAEVEPDVEYFIEVDIQRDRAFPRDKEVIRCCFEVDGTMLGYGMDGLPTRSGVEYFGAWERNRGILVNRALRFKRPSFSSKGAASEEETLLGTVRVKFHRGICEGIDTWEPSFSSQIDSEFCELPAPAADPWIMGMAVRTERGSCIESSQLSSNEYTCYVEGQLLETITIHYCTAKGLMYAGILQVTMWEYFRSKDPFRPGRLFDPRLANIKPKICKKEAVYDQNGMLIKNSKEWEVFDLSHLDTEPDIPGKAPSADPLKPRLANIEPKIYKRDALYDDEGRLIEESKEWEVFDLIKTDTDSDKLGQSSIGEDSNEEKPQILHGVLQGTGKENLEEVSAKVPLSLTGLLEDRTVYTGMEEQVNNQESVPDEIPLDLIGMVNDGIVPPPRGLEEKVDLFFICNFHGKSFDAFLQNYRRKVALRDTAKTLEGMNEAYDQAVKRHEAWEASITAAHFSR